MSFKLLIQIIDLCGHAKSIFSITLKLIKRHWTILFVWRLLALQFWEILYKQDQDTLCWPNDRGLYQLLNFISFSTHWRHSTGYGITVWIFEITSFALVWTVENQLKHVGKEKNIGHKLCTRCQTPLLRAPWAFSTPSPWGCASEPGWVKLRWVWEAPPAASMGKQSAAYLIRSNTKDIFFFLLLRTWLLAHLVFLQDPPQRLLLPELLLPAEVEDEQSQQDEEEHHAADGSRDGRHRSENKGKKLVKKKM